PARQLLGDDRHRHRVEPHAAVLRREDQAEVAELRHLADDGEWDLLVLVVEVVADRADLAVHEVAHRRADLLVVVASARVAGAIGHVRSWRAPGGWTGGLFGLTAYRLL